MKKNHLLILALITTFLYWVLDAYTNVSLYESNFWDEMLLKTPHVIPLIKILTAFLVFTLSLVPYFYTTRKLETPLCVVPLDALQKISSILFSPLSTKINITKSLEKLEEILELEASILFIYNRDTLSIYNENTFIKTFFRSKDIYPFKANDAQSIIEKIASQCFLEKRSFSQASHKIDATNYGLTSFMIKEDNSDKILGNLMLVSNSGKVIDHDIEWLNKTIEMLAFTLSLANKKENLLYMSNKSGIDNSSFDKTLGINNYIKLQEHIEHEVKRHKRYHTELTLILLEINMLKNLTNVFPEEIITNLKKDFVNLVKRNIRETDVLGKWTNDQFAIMLPDVDFRAAQGVAKKMQVLLEEHKFPRIGKITCNYGITSISPKDSIGTFKIRCESALALATSREGNAIEVKLLV